VGAVESAASFRANPRRGGKLTIGLHVVFLLSGVAALLYQLVWQRVLFTIYGIDTTSVTIVVTAFMLGLGVGSLVGGELSRRSPQRALPLFAAVEFGAGAFGIASLPLFAWVAEFTLGLSRFSTGLVTFLLVLIPTTLMGATLPLLVGHAARITGNVGRSVGALYFVNTLGAAVGSFAAVGVLLGAFGLQATTLLAAAINIGVGVAVLVLKRRVA